MAVRAAGAGFSHTTPSDRAGWDGRYTGAPMSTRAEVAVLGLLPLGLLAARALALDGPAVWCAAAIVVLVPGWAAVRLLRLERHVGMSGAIPVAFGLGLAVWTVPLAVAFLFTLPFGYPLAAVLILGWGGMAYALRRPLALEAVPLVEIAAGAAASVAFAFLTWRLSTGVVGDALFHVGRMRKIERVDGLSLTSISSFEDGAPHAGYAFPLLHAAWAGVARVAGVDAGTAFIQLAPLCGLAAILGIYAMTQRLTGWRLAGYLAAVVAAWDLCTLINGLIMQINQPPPFAFFVLAPAVVILFLASLRGVLLGAYASAAVIGVIALVHPTYAIPCLALMAGILAGSWRAHLAAARSAGVAIAVSGVATAAIAGWIWWVAIRGGERREIITHSDEFVHDGARALLMYPWAPVFGRGYVLVAIVACILLVRYRRTLPAAGAMLGMLGAAAHARGEHGRDGRGRDGAVPPLLAAAALAGGAGGGGLRRRAAARPVVDRGRRRPGGAAARAPRRAGFLARAGQLGGRRRHRGDRRRADPRAAPGHRPRPVVGGVPADRGDAGRADPAQRRHRARRGAGGAAPAAARRPGGRADARESRSGSATTTSRSRW